MALTLHAGCALASAGRGRAELAEYFKTLAGMAMIGYARVSTSDQNPEAQAFSHFGHAKRVRRAKEADQPGTAS